MIDVKMTSDVTAASKIRITLKVLMIFKMTMLTPLNMLAATSRTNCKEFRVSVTMDVETKVSQAAKSLFSRSINESNRVIYEAILKWKSGSNRETMITSPKKSMTVPKTPPSAPKNRKFSVRLWIIPITDVVRMDTQSTDCHTTSVK